MTFPDVVKDCLKRYDLNYKAMIARLNAYAVDPKDKRSIGSISFWTQGKHRPAYSWFDSINRRAPQGSWERDFTDKAMEAIRGQ